MQINGGKNMAVGNGGDEAVEQLINSAVALGNSTIDLSKKRLTQIPTDLLKLRHLEFLYLEGNQISSIPDELFECLPNLRWLDLRNNRLSEVSSIVGKHRNLRNLLLERNNITSLPLELGLVKSLSGLNLSGNPLVFPPANIVEKGTQEVLKFLRAQYLMHIQNNGGVIGDDKPEHSSSEELLLGPTSDSEVTWVRVQDEQVENENIGKVERFILPPIIQAAARPKPSLPDDTGGLLKAQKVKWFEPDKPVRSLVNLDSEQEQKPPVKTVKPESKSPRKDVFFSGAGSKNSKKQLEPRERTVSPRKPQKAEKTLVVADIGFGLRSDHYILNRSEGGKVKSEKTKRKRRARTESPQKNPISVKISARQDSNSVDVVAGPQLDKRTETSEIHPPQLPDRNAVLQNASSIEHGEARSFNEQSAALLTLNEGDMVAIKVPEKLYISGQPCLGKVICLSDQRSFLTVHFFTGSYEGRWRPMMSRTSPYLRKVPRTDLLYKFKLTADGRMSPITQRKLRTIVDDNRKQNGNSGV